MDVWTPQLRATDQPAGDMERKIDARGIWKMHDQVNPTRPPKLPRSNRKKSRAKESRRWQEKDIAEILNGALSKNVIVREGPHVRAVPQMQLLIEVLVEKASKGDLRALAVFFKLAETTSLFAPPPGSANDPEVEAFYKKLETMHH